MAKKEKKDPQKVNRVEWKKNGLRHSFISYRVAEIQNVNQVALECGNSPEVIPKFRTSSIHSTPFACYPTPAVNILEVISWAFGTKSPGS